MRYKELRDNHLLAQWPEMVAQLEAPPFRFGWPKIVNACVQSAFVEKIDNEHTDALREYLTQNE